MNPIDKLIQMFERFPGIGPRQARRFVQYMLVVGPSTRAELADALRTIGAATAQCKKCYRWFVKSASTTGLCDMCSSNTRDTTILFIVEKDADIENVERSGYKGQYFVLGGTIALASEEPEKYIRLRELLKRVESDVRSPNSGGGASGSTVAGLREVILGLSATTEGDHTRQILAEKLKDSGIKISSLGRGLSTGSEIEYADPDTIAEALGNRH